MNVYIVQGTIAKASIETSKKIVGYTEDDNEATITFTPGTTLSELGGKIEIKGPIWYGSERLK